LSSIGDIDDEMAKCVATAPWRGGSRDSYQLERQLYRNLTENDAIAAFGPPKMLKNIQELANPETSIAAYIRGLGMLGIGRPALSTSDIDSTLTRVAMSIAMFNRGACFSPQSLLVERGGEISPEEFSERLAKRLSELEEDGLPGGDFSGPRCARVAQSLMAYEIAGILGALDFYQTTDKNGRRVGGIVYRDDDTITLPDCGHRVVTVAPINDIKDIPQLIASYRSKLHTLGLTEMDGKLKDLSRELDGVKITPIDQIMPRLTDYDLLG